MVNKNRIDRLERVLNINDPGPLITEVIVHHSNGEQEIMTPEQAKKLEGEYIRVVVQDDQE
jgi:hypothetical protein